jgi:scyllo-inositol 2-dehydrogenase (NADP+)
MSAMRDAVGVGLVGYGMAGRVFHAPVITSVEGLRLLKVVERRAEESRALYPWVEVVRDAGALFEDEAVELVVVATPNESHFELARRALAAGRHVVVEKPFAVTTAEAGRLIELARERGRVLTAYHNRRWDGDFLTVRKILGDGTLGRLLEYESRYDRFRDEPRPGAWRERPGPGSGLLYDLGPHLIDQALVLFGRPRAVEADVRRQRSFAATDDFFRIALHYGEGPRVRLSAGMLAPRATPRFRLRGDAGSFVKYGLDPQEEALKRGRTPAEPGWGAEPPGQWGTLETEADGERTARAVETLAGRYQDFYRNVADAVRGRAALAVSPEDARDTVRVIELAFRSSAEGRAIPYS